jgi:hypothetical protein
LRVTPSLFPFFKNWENPGSGRVAVIPYATRNYENWPHEKKKVEQGIEFQAVYLHKKYDRLGNGVAV